ncbi:phosphomannomutase/phosphoglucomutase [Kerstersia gyiorum]|uniref:Phosphoglucomutase n=1 Tax=Kerstersia gyiorum TaxID=206506 RepID=A0A171KNC5_9BURK|nr:phosphomannomutase/phosphoglucomutase [Kerstersia gyiorum]KKO70392.1 phosphoglucomutase [Kerstersia gyiorum]
MTATSLPALPDAVFKAYDIRGTVPEQLNDAFAIRLGRALAEQARELGVATVVVGRDGRHSGPALSQALQQGLRQGGVDVVDIGSVPTPLVYFATFILNTGSGVAITGSHNPPQYNGFKIMLGGRTLHGEDILGLKARMAAPQPYDGPQGKVENRDLAGDYVRRITSDVRLQRPMKIALDAGNGVAGPTAVRLFEALGCEVTPLFCDIDGDFPNHHPDPADPHNLEDLIRTLQDTDCEIGLAFDGDGDRLGVVTKSGHIVWPDRQLILYARDILARQPGAQIIYDVKCTRHVALAVAAAGGKPLMWRTGHSLIKSKLVETGAPLAGEMSGHIFFKERWYGFDDGLYAGARLLEILSRSANPSEVLEALPDALSTPELKLPMQEGEPHALVAALQEKAQFPGALHVHTIDGVRAEYADGFGLARASNTTPVVVLRFEADSPAALERIKQAFKKQILALAPQAQLPF